MDFKMKSTLGWTIALLVIVLISLLFPLLVIWSLNTLFALTIAYTLETWSAVVILQILLHTSVKSIKGK